MGIEIESQGQVQEFRDILKKRRWQVLLPALFVFALGCALAVIYPRKYVVSTQIELRPVQVAHDPLLKNPANSSTRDLGSAAQQIKHYTRIQEVINELQWSDFRDLQTQTEQYEYILRVRDNLNVTQLDQGKQGTSFVEIEFKDIEGARAAEFLNRLALRWVTQVIERDRTILEKERDVLQNTSVQALSNHERLNGQIAELLKDAELDFSVLSAPGTRFGVTDDPYLTRLNTLGFERDTLEEELAALDADHARVAALHEREPETRPAEDSLASPAQASGTSTVERELTIETLKAQQKVLRPANPRWRTYQEQIQTLEEQNDAVRTLTDQEVVRPEFVENTRRNELERELETLEGERGKLSQRMQVIENQMAETRHTYERRVDTLRTAQGVKLDRDAAAERYRLVKAELEAKEQALEVLKNAYGQPYEIVERAVAPDAPSEPNPMILVAGALVIGLALGLGSAVLAEFSKTGFRGVGDVSRVMGVPILGVVNSIVTAPERRRRRVQKLVVGVSSALILVGIGWITYAYHAHSEWLSTEVLQGIEGLRMKLR